MTTGNKLPSRVVLHGVEGVGKTSFAAATPKPLVLMAKGETGLETLIDSGQAKETAHLPEIQTWDEFKSALDVIRSDKHDYQTLVLDTLNGFERLCHEHVCATQFNNDWGPHGFGSYAKGYDASVTELRVMLSTLDAIRAERRMAILALCHTKVETFKNPEGADYDRYQPELHKYSWGVVRKWADVILFANFYTVVTNEVKSAKGPSRGKGSGGTERVLLTERTAAWDAKNRHGLPGELSMGTTGEEAWGNFISAMKAGAA